MLSTAQLFVVVLRQRLGENAWGEPAADLLFAGMLAALGVGVFIGWRRSRALGNVWQQGVVSVLTGFGSLLAGFLAAPLHRVLGLPGIALWIAATATVGVAGSRWALRGSRGEVSAP